MNYSPEQIEFIESLYETHTWEEIAECFNLTYNKNKSPEAMRKAFKRYVSKKVNYTKPRILVLDIETAPMVVYTWGLWDQNIGLNQVLEDWSVLSFAAKWVGDDPDKIIYEDVSGQKDLRDDSKILKTLWKLIDEADILLTQNGISFDIRKINARFIKHGMKPPTSCRNYDTKRMAKRYFGFTSNKLEYMTDKLCTKYKKLKHGNYPGFSLWRACLDKDPKAWKEMKEYNCYDILSLEELFFKILPWDTQINFDVYTDVDINVCSCGSIDFKKNGFHYTNASKFQKYVCRQCGKEHRGKSNLLSTRKKKSLKGRANR